MPQPSGNLKHKETNTYRFKTFSEQLNEINVRSNLFKISTRKRDDEESTVTEAMEKWSKLDLTQQHVDFRRAIFRKWRNFALVTHNFGDIMQALEKHLQVKDTLALQSLLEILVATCQHDPEDFYPHFSKFFKILVGLLSTQDSKKIEWTFTCMAQLFQYLRKPMVKDLDNVLDLYISLFTGTRPAHISTFASQSVSFLLHKASNYKQVLRKLFTVFSDPLSSTEGMAKVLLEVVKSPKSRFHSCTAAFLPVLYSFLDGGDESSEQIVTCVLHSCKLMTMHTRREHGAVLLEAILNRCMEKNDLVGLRRSLLLLRTYCEVNQGSRLTDLNKVFDRFNSALAVSVKNDDAELRAEICSLAACLLKCDKASIEKEKRNSLVESVSNAGYSFDETARFWRLVYKANDLANEFAVRQMLRYCQRAIQDSQKHTAVVGLLLDRCLEQQGLPDNVEELNNYEPPALLFRQMKETDVSIGSTIKGLLKSADLRIVWEALVLATRAKPVSKSLSSDALEVAERCLAADNITSEHIAVVVAALQLICFLNKKADKIDFKSVPESLRKFVEEDRVSKHFLFCLDVVVEKCPLSKEKFSKDEDLKKWLIKNLSSSNLTISSLTLRILHKIDGDDTSIYHHLIQAVDTPNTVHDFRNRFIHLRKVDAIQGIYRQLSGFKKQAVIRTLFSHFYINFSAVWQPARDVILSFSTESKKDEFWQILMDELNEAFENAKNARWWIKSLKRKHQDETEVDDSGHYSDFLKSDNFHIAQAANTKADYFNYRLQLLKTVSTLPHSSTVEGWNRRLSELLFAFLKDEYSFVDSYSSDWHDLSDSRQSSDLEEVVCRRKDAVHTLVAIMSIFARFRNIKAAADEDKLLELYETFLTHSDTALQRVSLECLLTYKNKSLVANKDKLFEFFDDKKFRDALTTFDIKEMTDETREGVVPTLLRLLYGRMRSCTGKATHGKAHAPLRRSIVIRFIAGLDRHYIVNFFNMIATPFKDFLDGGDSVLESVKNAKAKAKENGKAVPVKKQLGFLGSVKTLLTQLNKDMPVEVYTCLYRVLLCIIASSATLIDADELVNRRHVAGLRSLKKVAAECLLSLMTAWSDQSILSSEQVDALFEVKEFYPALNKLVNENISSPTIELKLFMCLCKRVRYLPLLAKSIEGGRGYTSVADALVSLLVSGKPSPPVNGVIIEALNNALTATNIKDDDDDNAETPLTLQQCSAAMESVGELSVSLTSEQLMQPSAFSLELLRPSIGRVVKFFADRLRDKPTGVSPNELKLISIFSEHVDESCKETLEQLSKILIQHALKACGAQRINWKAITSSLETLYHVMRTPNLLFHLSPLFSKVRDREARDQLVLVFQRACEGSEHLKWTSEQVVALNKWDERRMDEIDYEARNIAFNNVVEVLKSDTKFASLFKDNCVAFLPIFQTCLHTLLHHSDESPHNVQRVFENTIKRIKELRTATTTDIDGESVYRLLIRELLLAILQKGVRSILTVVRKESIRALGLVVRTFPDEPTLQGFSAMVNETNPDDDSFNCLIHIQLPRQARALRKFSRHICPERHPEHADSLVDEKVVARSSALRYMLPYVCQQIYTVKLKKDDGYYREACLDLIKSCCTVMTWSQLKRFLVQTAKSIEKKPLALEILRASLDAFPFDLSLADDITDTGEDEEKKEEDDEVEEEKVEEEKEADDDGDDVDDEEEIVEEVDQDRKAQSQKIINDLISDVLPLLRRVLTRKMADEDSHKLARQHTPIEQCKSKLPLAIAMVSMLSKCPPNILKAQLCSVVHKIVDYLRHKQFQIREAARDSLCKCVALLGPVYLLTVLKVLHSELQRGYQKHVLVRTCCSLLSTLSPKLEAGDLNDSLSLLLEILLDDIFGRLGEDKKVDEVRAKIPEAKGRSRVYGALRSISASVSCDCLVTLIAPFRQQAERTNQHNIKKVIHDSLSEISQGLIENTDLQPVDYLTLVQNLLTDEDGDLFAVKETKVEEKFVQKPGMRPQSCYLLNQTPSRIGKKPIAKNSKRNLHLLIEFALQLCHLTIKRSKVIFQEQSHLELLDPLVEPLEKCLHAPNRQTIVSAMRCLQRLFRAELPSMEARMDSISKRLFKIVQEHSQDRLGDTETAMLSFKSLSVLCQSDYGESLNATQLQTLLVFAETDMNDTERQSHAFDLIKAILKRGLKNDDVAEVMRRIRNISIQAHSKAARNQARNLYVFYLIVYRKEMKHTQIARHVEFALQQFEYEFEDGRSSAMELISSLITDYPENLISSTHFALIFNVTTTMMKNDESATCRKMATNLVKLLLKQIGDENRQDLLSDVLQWYKSDEVARQQLAAMVAPLFAQLESDEGEMECWIGFERRLDEILDAVSSKLVVQPPMEDDDEDDIRDRDHSLIHHLSCCLSILQKCNVLNNTKWNNISTELLQRTQELLLHAHDWVRFISTQILGLYLRFYLTEENKQPEQVVFTPTYDLTKKFCKQLERVPFASAAMAAQVLQNIKYMMHVHDRINEEGPIKGILKNLLVLAKKEQAFRPKVIEQRTVVIKFCEYFTLNYSSIPPVELLELVLDPVQRAINATATHGEHEIDAINELHDLGNQCMDEIKKKVGIELFTEVLAKVTRALAVTRNERKMHRAQLAVTNPELAANKKINKQQKRKQQLKRKHRPEMTVTKKSKSNE